MNYIDIDIEGGPTKKVEKQHNYGVLGLTEANISITSSKVTKYYWTKEKFQIQRLNQTQRPNKG